jgi:hypothetical protein
MLQTREFTNAELAELLEQLPDIGPLRAGIVAECVKRLAAPPAGISPAPLAGTSDGWEVIGWEYRWLDTANKPNRWSAWERCRARNIHMNTDKDSADEIQAYIDMGNPYELRTLYARAALSQGDVSGEGEGS